MRKFGAPHWRRYDHGAGKHLANVALGDQVPDIVNGRPRGLVVPQYGGPPYGRPNPASLEPARWWAQAAIRSRDACRRSKQPSPIDGEKAPARGSRRGPRLDAGPFVRVGKSVGNSEMLGRFVCGFLPARADRRSV